MLVDVLTPDGKLEPFVVSHAKTSRADYRYLRKAQLGDTVAMGILQGTGRR